MLDKFIKILSDNIIWRHLIWVCTVCLWPFYGAPGKIWLISLQTQRCMLEIGVWYKNSFLLNSCESMPSFKDLHRLWGHGLILSQFENRLLLNPVLGGMGSVAPLHYCTWTDSIKPSLLFSFLWCAPCFQKQVKMDRDCCEFICGAPTTFKGYGIE